MSTMKEMLDLAKAIDAINDEELRKVLVEKFRDDHGVVAPVATAQREQVKLGVHDPKGWIDPLPSDLEDQYPWTMRSRFFFLADESPGAYKELTKQHSMEMGRRIGKLYRKVHGRPPRYQRGSVYAYANEDLEMVDQVINEVMLVNDYRRKEVQDAHAPTH